MALLADLHLHPVSDDRPDGGGHQRQQGHGVRSKLFNETLLGYPLYHSPHQSQGREQRRLPEREREGRLPHAPRAPARMCGIVGVLMASDSPAISVLYDALLALQHRGQDAAGIVTEDAGRLCLRKDNGMVRDVFGQEHIARLTGDIGIGECHE